MTIKTKEKDLKSFAYQVLKEKIINCDFAPGRLLNETMLTEELGISRTPIREALTRIEHEGLVRIMPKKGVLVTEISLNDVQQIFQTRLEIEPIALKIAAPRLPKEQLLAFRQRFLGEEPDVRVGFRLDTAMHLFIIEHCGNKYMIDMMYKVFEDNTRVIISSKQNETKIHDARLEHIEVLDLLLAGKTEQAEKSMRAHIKMCKNAAFAFFYGAETGAAFGGTVYQEQLEKSKG